MRMRGLLTILLLLLIAKTSMASFTPPNREFCLDFLDDRNLKLNGFVKLAEGEGYTLWPEGDLVGELVYFKGTCNPKDRCKLKMSFADFSLLHTKLYFIERFDKVHDADLVIYFYSGLSGDDRYTVLTHSDTKGNYDFRVIQNNQEVNSKIKNCLILER